MWSKLLSSFRVHRLVTLSGFQSRTFHSSTIVYVRGKLIPDVVSSEKPPTEQTPSLSFKQTQYTMQHLSKPGDNTRNFYQKSCQALLATNTLYPPLEKSSTLTPATLTHLPLNCMTLNDDENFVKRISLLWYKALEREMKNVQPHQLASTFYALAKINETCNGELVKILGGERVLKLANVVLDSCIQINPRKFATFLAAVRSLAGYLDVTFKQGLRAKLSNVTPAYVTACKEKRLKFSHDVSYQFGTILFDIVDLGIDKPEENCLRDIIDVSWRVFDSDPRRYDTNLWYLCQFDQLVSVFLQWSVDLSEIKPGFWSQWFQRVEEFYPITGSGNFFQAKILQNMLLVALQFNKLNELARHKSFFIQNLRLQTKYFDPEPLKMLLQKVEYKLNDEKLEVPAQQFLQDVKRIFETAQ